MSWIELVQSSSCEKGEYQPLPNLLWCTACFLNSRAPRKNKKTGRRISHMCYVMSLIEMHWCRNTVQHIQSFSNLIFERVLLICMGKTCFKIVGENHDDSSAKVIRKVFCSGIAGTQGTPLDFSSGQHVLHERAKTAVARSSPKQSVMFTGGRILCRPRLAKLPKAEEHQQWPFAESDFWLDTAF